jgi:hypothetical protein
MNRIVKTSLAVAILASVASVASAYDIYPPGPPYRSCPDSVTIFQLQQKDTLLNPCLPAMGDTVLGVRGVIVGFRPRSTGRIYIMNSNGADWNGVQIYTQSVHYENLGYAIGDSISILRGLMAAYNGETQLQGNTFIQVQKFASPGEPAPRIGTTTTFNWTPIGASHPALPSVGSFVRVQGPLRVARNTPGAGLYANTNWLCVNADGSFPNDSLLIDGYTLTPADIGAPPLGTIIDWVQGIMRRNTAQAGVDAVQISLRTSNDMQAAAPPNLSLAYPVAENKIRVIFDKNLDPTTAQNEANYTLGSGLTGSTVDDATLVGGAGAVVDLTVTEVLPRLNLESIQSENIGSATCPGCLSPQQSRTFILGVLSMAEVQAPLADSLLAEPCLDKSRFAGGGSAWGPRITVRGVVAGKQSGALTFLADAAGGLRSGVPAYNIPFATTVGNSILLACAAQEYYGLTELNNPVGIVDEGPATAPAPILTDVATLIDRSCDVNEETTNAEDFEGVLARIEQVKVVRFNDPWGGTFSPGGSFRVAGPYPTFTDTIRIDGGSGTHFPAFTPAVGQWLNVNGFLYLTDDRDAQLWPRSVGDIEVIASGVAPGGLRQVSLSVQPNPGTSHRVSFTVPSREKVELAVYDLLGRRLATLAQGEFPAGEYTRNWSGRTDAGTQVQSGVFFYKLKVGGEVRTYRAVKLN